MKIPKMSFSYLFFIRHFFMTGGYGRRNPILQYTSLITQNIHRNNLKIILHLEEKNSIIEVD